MQKKLYALFSCLALALLTLPAAANDSTGHLSAGGIVLGRTDTIEMVSEDLFVSAAEVRVTYRFRNTSDKDITSLVAFPLPELPAPSDMNNISIPTEDPVNFLGFKTTVDGKPVTMEVEQRAVVLGIDRTELLKSMGLPVSPQTESTRAALDKLTDAQKAELIANGLATEEEFDMGQGMRKYMQPAWSMRVTYHWTQTFPAGTELTVEHSYQPSVGSSAGSSVGADWADAGSTAAYQKTYCMDDAFTGAAKRIQKDFAAQEGASGGSLSEQRIGYILTTGANWAGPIKDFRLVIDKGESANLVSFCGDGVKKISDTQFEIRQKDYVTARDLDILILKRIDYNQ